MKEDLLPTFNRLRIMFADLRAKEKYLDMLRDSSGCESDEMIFSLETMELQVKESAR